MARDSGCGRCYNEYRQSSVAERDFTKTSSGGPGPGTRPPSPRLQADAGSCSYFLDFHGNVPSVRQPQLLEDGRSGRSVERTLLFLCHSISHTHT